MAFLAVLLLLFLVCANYLVHRDVMYPGFLQASLWLVAVSLFLLNREAFVPVSDGVLILLVAGVVLFSLGAFVGSYNHIPHLMRNYLSEGTLPTKRALALLAVAVSLGLVLYADRARQLASSGPSSNAFVNLRYAVSINQEETGGFGVVQYFVMLANVLAAIGILRRHGLPRPAGSRALVGATVLMGLVFGVLSSGRGPVLALVILIMVIPTVLRVKSAARTAASLVLVALLLFGAVGVALGKGGSFGRSLSENWMTMRESLLLYTAGPIPALNVYLHNRGPGTDWGFNSFRSIFAVLQALGFNTTAAPLVQAYVDVPMPFNAFTVYHPYIKDFDTLGAVLVLFVLGLLHAWLYRRATVRHPHAIHVFLFSISIFPLVMQAFQDMYLSLLSMWIQYGTYAVLFFVILSERGPGRRLRHPESRELRPVARPA